MTMRPLLTLLIMFALGITNGAAVANAICQHQGAQAHAAALESSDAAVSAAALGEELAAKAASEKGSLADASASLLAGYMLPPAAPSFPLRLLEPSGAEAVAAARLESRSVPPILEPPLA